MDELDLDVLDRKLTALTSVRQVFQAMASLARAQQGLAEAGAADAALYLDWVDAAVARLAGVRPAPDVDDALHVVLGPERPYCGPLPRRLLGQVPATGDLGLVGARLIELADRRPELAGRVRFRLAGSAAHDDPEVQAARVAAAVLDHARGRPVLLHHPRRGRASLEAAVLLGGRFEAHGVPAETYSPLGVVLEAALRELVTGRLTVGLAETLRAEIEARVTAAEAAVRASDTRIEELLDRQRAARQARITSELIEVMAGYEAAAVRPA